MINKLEKVLIFSILIFIIFFTTCCSNKKLNTINTNNNKYNGLKLEESIKDLETEKETLKRSIRLLTYDKKNLTSEIGTLKDTIKLQTYSTNYLRELLVNIINNNTNTYYLKKDNQPFYYYLSSYDNQYTFCGASGYILKTTHLDKDCYKDNFYVGKIDDLKSEVLLIGYMDTSKKPTFIYSKVQTDSMGNYTLSGEPIAKEFNIHDDFLDDTKFFTLQEYGHIKKIMIRGEIPSWYLQNEFSLKVKEIPEKNLYVVKDTYLQLWPEIDATNVQPITNGNALKIKSEYKDWYFAEIERKVAAEPINEGWISKSNLGYLDDVIKYRRNSQGKYTEENILEGIDVKVHKGTKEFDYNGNLIGVSDHEYWGYILPDKNLEDSYSLILPGLDVRIVKKNDVEFNSP